MLIGLAAILAYGVWFVRSAVVDHVKVSATAKAVEKAIEVEVVATGSGDGAVITVIDMERSLRDALGLSPPAGFTAAPMPLDAREKDDKEAAAYVEKYNREKVRYAGRLAVAPGAPTVLRFAAERPDAASGVIHLQHERKIGMGGSISFTSVTVGTQASP